MSLSDGYESEDSIINAINTLIKDDATSTDSQTKAVNSLPDAKKIVYYKQKPALNESVIQALSIPDNCFPSYIEDHENMFCRVQPFYKPFLKATWRPSLRFRFRAYCCAFPNCNTRLAEKMTEEDMRKAMMNHIRREHKDEDPFTDLEEFKNRYRNDTVNLKFFLKEGLRNPDQLYLEQNDFTSPFAHYVIVEKWYQYPVKNIKKTPAKPDDMVVAVTKKRRVRSPSPNMKPMIQSFIQAHEDPLKECILGAPFYFIPRNEKWCHVNFAPQYADSEFATIGISKTEFRYCILNPIDFYIIINVLRHYFETFFKQLRFLKPQYYWTFDCTPYFVVDIGIGCEYLNNGMPDFVDFFYNPCKE
jgi:hypothetical protein